MATEMAAASRAEPGTLMYDWYVNEDGTSGVLFEQYASQKALGDHVAGPVFTEIAPRYRGVARSQKVEMFGADGICLLYTSPSPRDQRGSRMPSSA